MIKIVILFLLVLSKEIHTTESENDADNTIKPQKVLQEQSDDRITEPNPTAPTATVSYPQAQSEAAIPKPVEPQATLRQQSDNSNTEPKPAPPTANVQHQPVKPNIFSQLAMIAQINKLADKVIKAHGVQPDSPSVGNLKNIQNLRQVVANVEAKLETKLKEKVNTNKAEVKSDNIQSQEESAKQQVQSSDIINNAEVINKQMEEMNEDAEIRSSEEDIMALSRATPDLGINEDILSSLLNINNLEAQQDVHNEEKQELPLQPHDIQPTNVNYDEVNKQEVIIQSKGDNGAVRTEIKVKTIETISPTEDKAVKKEAIATTIEHIQHEIKTPGGESLQEGNNTEREEEIVQIVIENDLDEENLRIKEINEIINAASKSDAHIIESAKEDSESETEIDEDEAVPLTKEENYVETCNSDEDSNCDQEIGNSHIYSAEYNEKIVAEEEMESISESGYISSFTKYIFKIFA